MTVPDERFESAEIKQKLLKITADVGVSSYSRPLN